MDEDVYKFPGLFAVGSSSDTLIKERWQNPAPWGTLNISGDLSDFGIVAEEWGAPNRAAIPSPWLMRGKVTSHYDMETLALLDFRIRWCRWYLDANGLPYDKEDILVSNDLNESGPEWCYVSGPDAARDNMERTDPLDSLSMWNFALEGPGYAGKILAHFKRAEKFLNKECLTRLEAISLSREMMLIGETWAEARFVINHAKAAVSGEKVAGGRRNSAHATNRRHDAMREERFTRMAELIPSLGVENAARQCELEGLGGWQAIKKQWDRYRKKRDT